MKAFAQVEGLAGDDKMQLPAKRPYRVGIKSKIIISDCTNKVVELVKFKK
jgi:hypothetical protein